MSTIMPASTGVSVHNPLELLIEARQFLTQRVLAEKLNVTARTISRWENGQIQMPLYIEPALAEIVRHNIDEGANSSSFSFIDLFAGIGGMRAGFEAAGGRCVFTSEWNPYATRTYRENFGGADVVGDIREQDEHEIPDHDVLVAGFPCQPFSIAGVSKKNALGRPHGFDCDTQGTLFFDVERIIAAKRPKAFLLENVKNLLSHDKGNTFRVIYDTLTRKLGYLVQYRVIDGQCFVPQHRERILIVGFQEETGFSFGDMDLPSDNPKLDSILHPEDGSEPAEPPYTNGPKGTVNPKYTLTDGLWKYLQAYADKHKKAGNGFGYGKVDRSMVARTLSARYYKDGSEILVDRGKGKNPRRLTPRECARLMGFPDSFRIQQVSDTQAYKQFGNSVIVPVIKTVAEYMKPHVLALKQFEETGTYQRALMI